MAKFIKRYIEHRQDQIQLDISHLNPVQNPIQEPQPLIAANNKRWNDYLCTNTGLHIIVIFVAGFILGINILVLYMYKSSIDEEDKMLLKYFIIRLAFTFVLPISLYVKNDKLLTHVKTEIFM